MGPPSYPTNEACLRKGNGLTFARSATNARLIFLFEIGHFSGGLFNYHWPTPTPPLVTGGTPPLFPPSNLVNHVFFFHRTYQVLPFPHGRLSGDKCRGKRAGLPNWSSPPLYPPDNSVSTSPASPETAQMSITVAFPIAPQPGTSQSGQRRGLTNEPATSPRPASPGHFASPGLR